VIYSGTMSAAEAGIEGTAIGFSLLIMTGTPILKP
jgi:hypothetical protein